MESARKKRIDPATTVIPLIIILTLCVLFAAKPEASTNIIGIIRSFLGDKLGLYYLIIGLGIFVISFWIAFSDIGKIRLGGKDEKPKYNFFTWGAMIFTCGLAADILFYSFSEWIYYGQEKRLADLGGGDSGLGMFNVALSLGTYSVEFLCGSCGMFRLYASRPWMRQAEVFRGMPPAAGEKDR